jgi:hypothetical protein
VLTTTTIAKPLPRSLLSLHQYQKQGKVWYSDSAGISSQITSPMTKLIQTLEELKPSKTLSVCGLQRRTLALRICRALRAIRRVHMGVRISNSVKTHRPLVPYRKSQNKVPLLCNCFKDRYQHHRGGRKSCCCGRFAQTFVWGK